MKTNFEFNKFLNIFEIALKSLLVVWIITLCFIPRLDTFNDKCLSTKVDDWSYVESEGLTIKFQGNEKLYNAKLTDKEFDLNHMVKNNKLDSKTCKFLSSKVK